MVEPKTHFTETEQAAQRVIGDRKLYGLRLLDGKKNNKVRFFIATYDNDGTCLEEVTSLVARVCKLRMTKDSYWILAGNFGYNPVDGIVETYALTMGKKDHPHGTL